jgi:hypothetical protein
VVVFSRPEVRSNVCRNIEVADLVTVSTERLAEVMSKRNRNVIVLPNCVLNRFSTPRTPPGPRDSSASGRGVAQADSRGCA